MTEAVTDPFRRANRDRWNDLVPIHVSSPFYDVAHFKAGALTLRPLEREELGPVAGKSLLHLQCHFGLDTLSWARLGAVATGVDFSEQAIAQARTLATEVGVPARFVCSDVYELPKVLNEVFDVVFTSHGVLCWLPDLAGWAQVIAHFLKPGGVFYVVDDHPFSNALESVGTELQLAAPYFPSTTPLRFEGGGSYADPVARVAHRESYEWSHSLGEILNALIAARLQIAFLHELPFTAYQKFPVLVQGADGWWRLPEGQDRLPLLFSLRATKPAI